MQTDEQAEKWYKHAFTCYVKDWKKQDESTIRIENGIYSYTTKRGVRHSFRLSNKPTGLKVQSIYFEQID